MFALLTRWKLKNGCPPELLKKLNSLCAQVLAEEPGTLLYGINLPGSFPPIGPAPEYEVCDASDLKADASEDEIVFFEVYEDAEAYSKHLQGAAPLFIQENIRYFKTPWQGHPRPQVLHLNPQAFLVRDALSS